MIITQRISGLEVHSCKPSRPLAGAPPLVFIHGAFAGGWMWVDTLLPALAEAGIASILVKTKATGGSAKISANTEEALKGEIRIQLR